MKLLSEAMQKIPRLSQPLTNYQFKPRQFIQTFHPTISQHQRYTRINRPIGLFRRHETPDPLLPPDIFKPKGFNQNPEELFQPRLNTPSTSTSFLLHHINDFTKTLIYIDGASIGNGTPDAKAGYGVYRSPKKSLNICRPLPIGTTNNRAELWAAVSALELIAREPTATDSATSPPTGRDGGSGSGTVVDTWIIASDSQYVVMGATDWAWKRRAVGWKKSKNAPEVGEMELSEEELALGKGLIPNADLWDRLLRGIMNVRGQVLFWLIEREWNQADSLASAGAVRIFFSSFFPPSYTTTKGVG
ncbi:ribonuclease H-like domain-containing protein [Tuber borchii]|uniref:ribonuclease H n=1 Tax=Tuber borchii TaxID=42251 RepID=A0A2T7A628_TUBBO|nr:ribonuclease H-like domain-containing protein [Tuber borchii]